jgi:hypothetical protein
LEGGKSQTWPNEDCCGARDEVMSKLGDAATQVAAGSQYLLGHSERELERLQTPARILNRERIMSKHMLIPFAVVLAIVATIAQLVAAIPDVGATSRCEAIGGTLTSTANLISFTTQGTISGDLEGTTFFRGDQGSLTAVTANTSPPLNATDHYTGDLTITTKQGVLTTRSVGVFELIGNGLGTQFDRVLGDRSSGKFAGASGQLYFNFAANDSLTGFTSTYTGRLCG